MGLSSSLWTSVSGLLAHGEKMNVVGNNLANVSTIGFKAQRMDFEDFIYQNKFSAGGTTQIGLGVGINAVIGDFSQGSFESTNSATDLAIGGSGYFQVRDSHTDEMYYTRAGNFNFDNEGYLRLPSGETLQGWPVDNTVSPTLATGSDPVAAESSTAIRGSGVPGDIILDTYTLPPKATSKIGFTVNLTADNGYDKTTNDNNPLFAISERWNGKQPPVNDAPPLAGDAYAHATNITVYDEGGGAHLITTYFDQVDKSNIENLPEGYEVYEYVVTMDPSEDMRTFGGTYDPDTGILTGATSFQETEAAGILMKGTITFDAAGNMVDQTAYTYMGNTDYGPDQIIQAYDATGAVAIYGQPFVSEVDGTGAPVTTLTHPGTAPVLPKVTDVDAGGNLLYPLGDADPGYIAALAAYETAFSDYNLALNTYDTAFENALGHPESASSWQPTAVSNDGYPVFSANFSGHPLGNSVHQDSDLMPSAEDSLIEFDLGMQAVGSLNTPFSTYDASGRVKAPIETVNPGETTVSIADVIDNGVDPVINYQELATFTNAETKTSATTNREGDSIDYSRLQDGYTSGSLTNIDIDGDGILYGYYSNGVNLPMYQITMYDFINEQGLQREGGNLFSATRESGNPMVGAANEAGFGEIVAYNIEQSNVDMTREFVQMIATQRGFQSNSKGITTVDSMLEQVINMKR